MSLDNATDHWAFLEEIEAPMWADLGLEAKPIDPDIDDDWFNRGHKFHQCSSCELKSFFRSGFGSLEASSPTLPQSVTRSRGSDYKSKKWGRSNRDVPFTNHQAVKDSNGSSSEVYSGSRELKNQLRSFSLKATSASSSNKSSNSSISGDAKGKGNHLKAQVACRTSESGSSCVMSVENSRMNIVTSGCHQQKQQWISEAMSRAFGKKSVLQSAVEISMRRSFVTRPALRAETSHCREQSRDQKSSSGKSSVGSSSTSASSSNKSSNPSISGDAKGKGNHLKAQVACRTSESGSSCVMSVENSRMNIVTFGCHQQKQQRTSEAMSRPFGKKSVLQSAVEISMRRSFVTRPALRAETSHCREQSRDRKSSSGKSSVGSSSNPGHSLKYSGVGLMKKEQTPNSSSVPKITEAAKHKRQVPVMSNASNIQVKGRTLSSRTKVLGNITNQTCREASKSKVQPQTFSSKVIAPLRSDEQKLLAASSKDRKVGVTKLSKMVALKVDGANSAMNRIGFSGKGDKKGEPHKIDSKMHSVASEVNVGSQKEAKNLAKQRLYYFR